MKCEAYSCLDSLAGTTYAPEGSIVDNSGHEVAAPAELPAVCALAQCCALCNDSTLYYAAGGPWQTA